MGNEYSAVHYCKSKNVFAISRFERKNIMPQDDKSKEMIWTLFRSFDPTRHEIFTEDKIEEKKFSECTDNEVESIKFTMVVEDFRNKAGVGIFLGFDEEHGLMFLSHSASEEVCSHKCTSAGTEFIFCDTAEWQCNEECKDECCPMSDSFENFLATNKPFFRNTLTDADIRRWKKSEMTYVGGVNGDGTVHVEPGHENSEQAKLIQRIASALYETPLDQDAALATSTSSTRSLSESQVLDGESFQRQLGSLEN